MTVGGLGLVVDRLACPHCRSAMTCTDSAVVCGVGHSFDVARQGYVSLFGGGPRASTGDTAAMVAARERLLGGGHYAPIADALDDAVAPGETGLCVDLAGGTGYYATRVLDSHPGLVAVNLDLSIAASRRAARAHPRLAAVATDVWQPLPLQSGTSTCVLSVFGPRNLPEIKRILAPGGQLVLVTPTARHLAELVGPLRLVTVDPRKQERIADQLAGWKRVSTREVEYDLALTHADVMDDVLMGPSAHHVDPGELAGQVSALPEPVRVSVSVTVTTLSR